MKDTRQFYISTDASGIITPHWVDGEKEVLCSVEILAKMIENHNANVMGALNLDPALITEIKAGSRYAITIGNYLPVEHVKAMMHHFAEKTGAELIVLMGIK